MKATPNFGLTYRTYECLITTVVRFTALREQMQAELF